MNNNYFFWDGVAPKLAGMLQRPWGRPIRQMQSRRQEVSTVFAMRSFHRWWAIGTLFKQGLYIDSHPLIRHCYEDWLQLAYLLRKPGDERCEEFWTTDIDKYDARAYDGFKNLCGQEATNHVFKKPPPSSGAAKYIGLPRSKTGFMSYASMADDIGLRVVHDFAYTYLSGRSHPSSSTIGLFENDPSTSTSIAVIPKRNVESEILPAFWFSWFLARIIVLATNEFGFDNESFCDDNFPPKGSNLETCVFEREYQNV